MKSRLVSCLALALAAAACAGDGVIIQDEGPPASNAPTLTQLQASIFSPRCGVPGCHGLPAPEQGMNLSDGNTYAYTVGVSSVELSIYKRVSPRDAADSYLYMKIAGDPRIAGDRMPFGGRLSDMEIEAVRAWIDAGALNN